MINLPFESGENRRPDFEKTRVVVVSDPGSDPPEWVRTAWLGVEFEAIPVCNPLADYRESGSDKPREPAPFWEVPSVVAVDALREFGQERAAQWWDDTGLYVPDYSIVFPITSCKPLDGSRVIFPDLN